MTEPKWAEGTEVIAGVAETAGMLGKTPVADPRQLELAQGKLHHLLRERSWWSKIQEAALSKPEREVRRWQYVQETLKNRLYGDEHQQGLYVQIKGLEEQRYRLRLDLALATEFVQAGRDISLERITVDAFGLEYLETTRRIQVGQREQERDSQEQLYSRVEEAREKVLQDIAVAEKLLAMAQGKVGTQRLLFYQGKK